MSFKHRRLLVSLLVLLALGLGLSQIGLAEPERTTTVTITSPGAGGVSLAALDDFATTVMGDPWDMNQTSDTTVWRSRYSKFTNPRYEDGQFVANLTTADGQERIMLLYAGALDNDAMRIGKTGYTYPINADKYRYLTYRLYTNAAGFYSGILKWHSSDAQLDPAESGTSNTIAPVPANGQPGWEIYTIDLATIGIQQGQRDWGGIIRELQIIPIAGGGLVGSEIRLDYAMLTDVDPRTARPYTIEWTGGSGLVKIYASPGNQTIDSTDFLLTEFTDASVGSFTWQTGVVPPGDYHIYIEDSDGGVWSQTPVTIDAPPILTIDKPSRTSGPDFATDVLGNAWDMSDDTDINLNPPPPFNTWLANARFENGIFKTNTLCCGVNVPIYGDISDPQFFMGNLNLNPPGTPDPKVDTNRYRYFSFRMYTQGEQSFEDGWVARLYWWQAKDSDSGTNQSPSEGRDILLYENWTTYKLDLHAADVLEGPNSGLAWTASAPNRIRLDPNEFLPAIAPGYVELDWVKLTAVDEATQGTIFPIQYTASESNVTVTAYYDTDTDPGNGRTPVTVYAPTTTIPANLPLRLYMPIHFKGPAPSGEQIMWDTTGVAPGTYYISLDAGDGVNNVTWYSEAPVNILAP